MRGERGFTLVEVVMALLILTVVLLGLGAATGRFLHVVTTSDRRSAAIQLAEDRIEWLQLEPDYAGLDGADGSVETGFPTLAGLTRTTTVVHVGGPGQQVDYRKVTVTVDGPGLLKPVRRTVTVAAP